MLSYTWANSIGDIGDTVLEHCRNTQQDPKRTCTYAYVALPNAACFSKCASLVDVVTNVTSRNRFRHGAMLLCRKYWATDACLNHVFPWIAPFGHCNLQTSG